MSIEHIRQVVASDLLATDQLILSRLQSDVVLINQIGQYITHNGGKRVRPLLTILAARACGYEGMHHQTMAAVIEFIHTSTLLHDDVVDNADTRRGHTTANVNWGNAASILVGDFLYSRSFQMMVEPGMMKILEIMADATNTIAEGEVLQLLNCRDPHTTEKRYHEVIYRKTAKLFEASARLGAVLATKSEFEVPLMTYGKALGTAYQLIDDVLDYTADESALGKTLGKDLAEGKPTLPLILALARCTESEKSLIENAIEQGNSKDLGDITQIIHRTGGIEDTYKEALKAAEDASNAANQLPASAYQQALIELAHLSVHRQN